MIIIRRLPIAAVLGGILLVWTGAVYAEQVRIQASQGDDFGRIVFTWDQPVSYEMIYGRKTLTVRFGRPIKASFQRIMKVMKNYINRVAVGNEGKSVTFSLTRLFQTAGFDSGNSVIIEIVERGKPATSDKEGSKPAPTQDKKQTLNTNDKAGTKSTKIRVRTGQHPAYSRIVIDWPKKVDYVLEQNDGVVTVRIKGGAELQIGKLQRRPPRFVGSVRTRVEMDKTILEMAVAKSSKVRHFFSGSKLVLDVPQPTGSQELARLPSGIPETKLKNTGREAIRKIKKAGKLPIQLTAPKKKTVSEIKNEVLGPSSNPMEGAGNKNQTQSSKKSKSSIHGKSRDPSPRVMEPIKKPIELGTIIKIANPEGKPEEEEASGASAEGQEQAATKDTKPGKNLEFKWKETVAAALFKRFGYLWVVFDRPSVIDVEALRAAAGPYIESIDSAPTPEATILRLRLPKPINPELYLEGSTWILNIAKREPNVPNPIDAQIELESAVGPRIYFPISGAGKPVGITDPTSGDNLVVVPVEPQGHGIDMARTYPQLLVLPSFQGIVIKPLADDIRIRPLIQGVELTSGTKLALSPVSPDDAAKKLARKKPLTNILELEEWEVESLEEFNAQRQEIQGEIAAASGEQRIAKRYNLARFYFSNRFGAEALGVLSALQREKPEIEKDPEFRLIRGGASYIMGRFSDAAADFSHDSLDGLDEGNFWRAAVVAKIGDLLAAAPALTRAGVFTNNYPKPLRLQMGTLVADAAVELGETGLANTYIKAMKKLKPNDMQMAEVEFVEGRLLDFKEDPDGAIAKWKSVEQKPNKKMRARAVIARLDLLLKLERINRREAIKGFEALRFDWRGDQLEFEVLRRLGDLYLDEGFYREGFIALRQAVAYSQNKDTAKKITQKMERIFAELYLRDGADAMSAVKAIAVYQEFEELTPTGAKGDEMIRKLADRLVAVDLLNPAANILENQVQSRLNGVLKSQVGARLAIVYLLARRYDRALAALDASTVINEPIELLRQRRHLRARALIGLEQSDLALRVLQTDQTIDANLLRAELFSKEKDWNNAARIYGKIMRASGAKKKEDVNPEQAQTVLNYAIALVLAGNERALAIIRRDYGAALQKTKLKDAFQLVSSPIETGLINPSAARAGVKIAENFKNFMSEYKKRLRERGLSGSMPRETAKTTGGSDGAGAVGG